MIFTVTDACGNASTASALLVITDDVPPTITTQAQNLTVECDGTSNDTELQNWLDTNASAMALDACSSSLEWTYEMRSSIGSCGGVRTSLFDFFVTDACDNTSVRTTAAFIIEDSTSPVYDILPVNLTVECDGAGNEDQLTQWLTIYGGASASDICSEPISWSYDLVREEDSCGLTGSQVYRFTIFDDCGNTSTAEATFTIEDTESTVITAGADEILEDCDDNFNGNILEFDSWLNNNGGATATDVCGDITWTNDYNVDNWVSTCGSAQFVDVVFTATDDCGNSDSVTHRFGVGDVSPPQFINCPRPPVVAVHQIHGVLLLSIMQRQLLLIIVLTSQ